MNIERFIEARKASGLSQNELSDGICTQATLSRFENNSQVPSLKILMKLCNRLNVPLGELFPKVGVKHSEIIEKMNQAEFYLITSEYELATALLDAIAVNELAAEPLLARRFHYLKGFVMIAQQAPVIDILFMFDQILVEEETNESEIFNLLAFTGIGMTYARENDLEKAEFYFQKVLERIYQYPAKSTEDTWRVLNIVFQSGVFFSRLGELEIGNALLQHAVIICSDNHVTYYLARAAIQLAENAIIQKEPKANILESIYDARAYSKINRNTIALEKLARMEEEVLAMEDVHE